MSDSLTTATPETKNAAPTAHPPVRENQMEAEVDRSQDVRQRVMRSIGGGSPETPSDRFAGALGQGSGSSQAGMLRQLQRSYGNSYVGRVIQAKLTVDQPGDMYEQEADRVANQVMRMSKPEVSQGVGLTGLIQPMQIQRMCTECQEEEKRIHHKEVAGQTPTVTPAVEARLDATSGRGAPLPEAVRSFMEPRFGVEFSGVRIHTGGEAATLNRELSSHAFTRQRDIYFGIGKYNPESNEGKQLIAHELTHVVQQSSKTVNSLQRQLTTDAITSPTTPPPASTTATSTNPPVLFGLDTTTRQVYASVKVPGHQLIEISVYLYGSAEMAESLNRENGGNLPLVVPIPPGRPLRLAQGTLTQTAHSALNNALQNGTILRTEGVPSESETNLMVYRFSADGQSFELTEGQFNGLLRGLSVYLTRQATSLRDSARNGREVQQDHIRGTNLVIRGISNLIAGQDVPNEIIWDVPELGAQRIIDRLSNQELTADLISRNARALQIVAESLDKSYRVWHNYIEGTISGAGGAVHALEITRNVSFGIAAGIAGAIAAPAVFAAGTAVLGTGTAGTVVSGSLAIAGGTAAGTVTGAGLEFTGAVGGEAVSMAITPSEQTFDWSYVWERTVAGARSGAIQGGIGAAGALVAPGLSNLISNRLFGVGTQGLTSAGSQALVRGLTGIIIGTPSGATSAALENLPALLSGRISASDYLASIGIGTLWGLGGGALFSLLPIRGLYRDASGNPVTPEWMLPGVARPTGRPVPRLVHSEPGTTYSAPGSSGGRGGASPFVNRSGGGQFVYRGPNAALDMNAVPEVIPEIVPPPRTPLRIVPNAEPVLPEVAPSPSPSTVPSAITTTQPQANATSASAAVAAAVASQGSKSNQSGQSGPFPIDWPSGLPPDGLNKVPIIFVGMTTIRFQQPRFPRQAPLPGLPGEQIRVRNTIIRPNPTQYPNHEAHHVLPLALNGRDIFPNVVPQDRNLHQSEHYRLCTQPHLAGQVWLSPVGPVPLTGFLWGGLWGPGDPFNTPYIVRGFK